MATVLTTSMTLRIILSVRGTLEHGGSFALSASVGNSSRTTHISGRSGNPTHISTQPHTYNLDQLRTKPEGEWGPVDPDNKSSLNDAERKNNLVPERPREPSDKNMGVKVTINRDIDGYRK